MCWLLAAAVVEAAHTTATVLVALEQGGTLKPRFICHLAAKPSLWALEDQRSQAQRAILEPLVGPAVLEHFLLLAVAVALVTESPRTLERHLGVRSTLFLLPRPSPDRVMLEVQALVRLVAAVVALRRLAQPEVETQLVVMAAQGRPARSLARQSLVAVGVVEERGRELPGLADQVAVETDESVTETVSPLLPTRAAVVEEQEAIPLLHTPVVLVVLAS